MGAWDYGALDNDPALDVIQRWEEWVKDPAGMGYEKGIEHYFKYWGDAVRYGDSITNCEIIALVAIHLNEGREVPKQLKRAAIDALNRELVQEELKAWSEPEKRKTALLKLLEAIGGTVKPPKPPKLFRDSSLHFKNATQARTELLRFGKRARSGSYSGKHPVDRSIMDEVPPFLRSLHRLMQHRLWEKDQAIWKQGSLERRMMLAWYLWLGSGRSLDDLAEMLDNCRRSR